MQLAPYSLSALAELLVNLAGDDMRIVFLYSYEPRLRRQFFGTLHVRSQPLRVILGQLVRAVNLLRAHHWR